MQLLLLIIFILVAIVITVTLACYLMIEVYARRRVFDDVERIPDREFALVLGTGPTRKDGQPNRYFVRRMNAAAELYAKRKVKRFILSGDQHEDYDEPAAMLSALSKHGIPQEVCILDGKGYDTIDSILNARDIPGSESITIVSQEFHCERAVFISGCLGIKAIAFAAEDVEPFMKSKTKVREIPARVKVFVDLVRVKLHLR